MSRLEEVVNRRPKGWRNLTIKEFDRDIKFLQEIAKRSEQALINQERSSDAEIERLEKRVEELEKDVKEWEVIDQCWKQINEILAEKNKRYKQALEYYANNHTWHIDKINEVARKALDDAE